MRFAIADSCIDCTGKSSGCDGRTTDSINRLTFATVLGYIEFVGILSNILFLELRFCSTHSKSGSLTDGKNGNSADGTVFCYTNCDLDITAVTLFIGYSYYIAFICCFTDFIYGCFDSKI